LERKEEGVERKRERGKFFSHLKKKILKIKNSKTQTLKMTPAENLSAVDHTSQRPPPLDLKDLKEPSSTMSDEQWTLCCSKSSKQFVMYLTQTLVLMSVLIFAIAMLASAQEGQNRDLYVSLLSSVLGIYLPAPQIHDVK
jgi:hypothetical protein